MPKIGLEVSFALFLDLIFHFFELLVGAKKSKFNPLFSWLLKSFEFLILLTDHFLLNPGGIAIPLFHFVAVAERRVFAIRMHHFFNFCLYFPNLFSHI